MTGQPHVQAAEIKHQGGLTQKPRLLVIKNIGEVFGKIAVPDRRLVDINDMAKQFETLGFEVTVAANNAPHIDAAELNREITDVKADAVLIHNLNWDNNAQYQGESETQRLAIQQERIGGLLAAQHPTMPYAGDTQFSESLLGGELLKHYGRGLNQSHPDANERIAAYLQTRIKGEDHAAAFSEVSARNLKPAGRGLLR